MLREAPLMLDPSQANRTQTVGAMVRGLCYLCTSPSHIQVTFDKTKYFSGEIAKVSVDCDNTRCKHDATHFIIVLKRHVWLCTDDLN